MSISITDQNHNAIVEHIRENAKILDNQSLEHFEKEYEEIVKVTVDRMWEKNIEQKETVKKSIFKRLFSSPQDIIQTKEEMDRIVRKTLEDDGTKNSAYAFFMLGICYAIKNQVENIQK